MAILEQGLIGTFRGKMGAIVIAKWKDLYVGRGKPKKSGKLATETQLVQRTKFGLLGQFLAPVADTLVAGYKGTGSTTSLNEAMRYNLKNAVTGIYPDYTLNYAKIGFSDHNGRGRIDLPFDPLLVPVIGNSVKFSWGMELDPRSDTKATDVIYAIFYHPLNDRYHVDELVRSKLTSQINLSRSFIGEVHSWIFVASDNKKFVSGTEYLGKVTVIA